MMSQTRLLRGVGSTGAVCGIALGLWVTPVAAKENKSASCTAAYSIYKSAIEKDKAGQELDARELYAACAEATNCAGIAPKCDSRYGALVSKIPTVVPVVRNEKGALLVDVDVKVDGRALTSHLDGKGLPVEPGVHKFTFSTDRGGFATQDVMIVEGQHDREIAVSMGGAKPIAASAATPIDTKTHPEKGASSEDGSDDEPAADKPSPGDSAQRVRTGRDEPSGGGWTIPTSVFPYLLGVVGLAGVAGGGVLTYWGNQDNNLLRNSCGGTAQCKQSSVDHIKRLYVEADISYGVGAAALTITTFLFATSRSKARDAVVVGVEPTTSGGIASISGKF
jgi:hypothetical protein